LPHLAQPAGEEPHSGIVASITTGAHPIVTCVEDERLEFQVCVYELLMPRRGGAQSLQAAQPHDKSTLHGTASKQVTSSTASRTVQDGELVTFSEVVGMTQLNGHKPIRVKNCKVICAWMHACSRDGCWIASLLGRDSSAYMYAKSATGSHRSATSSASSKSCNKNSIRLSKLRAY
jgi:hypothetical protein